MNRPAQTLNLNTAPAAPATPKTARRLALGAIAGPVLFTLAWLVLGFLSPGYTLWDTLIAPYSPIHQPISGLGMGPTVRSRLGSISAHQDRSGGNPPWAARPLAGLVERCA